MKFQIFSILSFFVHFVLSDPSYDDILSKMGGRKGKAIAAESGETHGECLSGSLNADYWLKLNSVTLNKYTNCGACANITNIDNRQSWISRVAGVYSICSESDIRVSINTYKKLASRYEPNAERQSSNIRWFITPCPNTTQPVFQKVGYCDKYHCQFKVTINSHKIQTLQIKPSSGTKWTRLVIKPNQDFVIQNLGPEPFDFRITSHTNQMALETTVVSR